MSADPKGGRSPVEVAVTGATGFIGRHVVERLLEDGHRVLAVSRDGGAARSMPWADRVEHLFCDVSIPEDDVLDRISRADLCIHLAWGSLSNFRSLAHLEVELPTHYGFLKRLVTGGLPKLVAVGTCLEYGLQSGKLEETAPTDAVTPYGLAKDVLRRQLEFLQAETPFSLGWGRLFYIHGECEGRRTLYMQLKAAAERGEPTFPMSGGEQLRDYLHVRDVADRLVRLGYADDPGVVNICSGVPISVRALVEGWMRDNGWNIELELGRFGYPDYEPLAFWGSAERLEELAARPLDPSSQRK